MTPSNGQGAVDTPPTSTRLHVRVEVRLGVAFSLVGENSPRTVQAFTRDISHGGACLSLSRCPEDLLGVLARLPLLDLAIDLSPAAAGEGILAPATLRGQVEWVHPAAQPHAATLVGLEFRDVSPADETAIIDLIAHLLLDDGV